MDRRMKLGEVCTYAALAATVVALAAGPARGQTCFDLGILAGRGVGDGGPGPQAVLMSPRQVAIDGAGNVFIADALNDRIRRWDAAGGTVTTFAGEGAPQAAVEGQPATLTGLKEPSGVALFGTDVYIADTGHDVVWKVAANGVLTRVAGSGITTGSIDGDNPGKPGNDPTDDLNDGQLAASATLNTPVRLAIDAAGNVFIADLGNGRVRKVDAATHRISSVAMGLTRPSGLAIGAGNTLYVSDAGANRVFKLAGAALVPFAGTGTAGSTGDDVPAVAAQLNGPTDVAVDAGGVVFIADTQNNVIRKVTTDGHIHHVVGDGNLGFREGGAIFARFNHPGVALGIGGALIIGDADNNRVRKYDVAADATSTIVGDGNSPGDGGPATAAILNRPAGLAIGASGTYVSEHDSHRVRLIDAAGTITTVVNRDGVNASAVDGTPAVTSPLRQPTGVAVDGSGAFYVADAQDHRVFRIDASGTLHDFAGKVVAGVGVAGKGGENVPANGAALDTPLRIAIGSDGSVYITDFNNNRIRRVTTDGNISTAVGSGVAGSADGPATTAQLTQPSGLAFDGTGNMYIADFGNNLVRKVDSAGNVTRIAGVPGAPGAAGDGGPAASAMLNGPTDVVIDKSGGLLVVDQLNNKVRRIAPGGGGSIDGTGTITTILGDGRPALAVGPGPQASMLIPTDVEIDGAGRIIVADRGNQVVRVATPGNDCGGGAGGGGSGPCHTNADCNDNDACTIDTCGGDGVCRYDAVTSSQCIPHCDAEPKGCIPGGGSRRTDCLVETLVRAPLVLKRGVPQSTVRCHDGDRSCDFDNVQGQCTFRVAWCLNEVDPRFTCSASGVSRLRGTGKMADTAVGALLQLAPQAASQAGRSVRFSPAFTNPNACTRITPITVALRKHGRKPGSVTLNVKATAASPRRADTDAVKLICTP